MRSLPIRLAITFLLPLLLVIGGEHVLLPGMDDLYGSIARRGAAGLFVDRSNASVFALGIMPMLTAYGIVELTAFLVPRWSRLRHGNPEGRVRLERAARVLAMGLAALQAWGISRSLAALEGASGVFATGAMMASTPVVMATLVGGVCVQIIVAEILSRQGIANGYVLLTVVDAIASLRGSFAAELRDAIRLGTLETRHLLLLFLVIALPVVATWLALRGSGRASRRGTAAVTSAEAGSAGPYRAARALAVAPWVPVPSSSLAPYPMAASLLALPVSLSLVLPVSSAAGDLAASLTRTAPFTIGSLLLTGGLAVAFAKLLHRPREMADVASRVGFAGGEELAKDAHATLRATLLPTLLFFATLICSSMVGNALPARPSIVFLPLLVALVMDVAGALRAANLVAVWQERRASAVPVVRAVLAAEGIEAKARGMSVLSLLQVFAPYAPAVIMVPEADAARATSVLRHVFLGEKRPDAERAEAPPPAVTGSSEPANVDAAWTPARRVLGLGGTALLSLVALVAALRPTSLPPDPSVPRGHLEVVAVDDESDVFGPISDGDLPPGIELRVENVPTGPGRTSSVTFASARRRANETYAAASARLTKWTGGLKLPEGTRIRVQPIDDFDEDTGKQHRVGARTFLLTGPPVITTDDVLEAAPLMNDTSGMPEVYVAITLTPDAAERFRIATRERIQRRVAIVVNDQVESAPVVRSEIGGGRLSITMGAGDPERQLVEAKKLAQSLAPR